VLQKNLKKALREILKTSLDPRQKHKSTIVDYWEEDPIAPSLSNSLFEDNSDNLFDELPARDNPQPTRDVQ